MDFQANSAQMKAWTSPSVRSFADSLQAAASDAAAAHAVNAAVSGEQLSGKQSLTTDVLVVSYQEIVALANTSISFWRRLRRKCSVGARITLCWSG